MCIRDRFSHGLVNSAMGQIPCSTERISCLSSIGPHNYKNYITSCLFTLRNRSVTCGGRCHIAATLLVVTVKIGRSRQSAAQMEQFRAMRIISGTSRHPKDVPFFGEFWWGRYGLSVIIKSTIKKLNFGDRCRRRFAESWRKSKQTVVGVARCATLHQ